MPLLITLLPIGMADKADEIPMPQLSPQPSTGGGTLEVSEDSQSIPCGQAFPDTDTVAAGGDDDGSNGSQGGRSTGGARKRKIVIDSDTDSDRESQTDNPRKKHQAETSECYSQSIIRMMYKNRKAMRYVDNLVIPFLSSKIPVVLRRMLSIESTSIKRIIELELPLKLVVRKMLDIRNNLKYISYVRLCAKRELTEIIRHIIETVVQGRLSSLSGSFQYAWEIFLLNDPFVMPSNCREHEVRYLSSYYELFVQRVIASVMDHTKSSHVSFSTEDIDSLVVTNDGILVSSWYAEYVSKDSPREHFIEHVSQTIIQNKSKNIYLADPTEGGEDEGNK